MLFMNHIWCNIIYLYFNNLVCVFLTGISTVSKDIAVYYTCPALCAFQCYSLLLQALPAMVLIGEIERMHVYAFLSLTTGASSYSNAIVYQQSDSGSTLRELAPADSSTIPSWPNSGKRRRGNMLRCAAPVVSCSPSGWQLIEMW